MINDVLLHKIRLPLFNSSLWVIIANSMQKAIDFAEDKTCEKIAYEEDKKHLDAYSYAYEKENGGKQYILFLKPNCSPGTIAHEVKHLINVIFTWHGYKLSASNDEMECYYLGDIIDKVHNTIKKYKKSKLK